MKRACLLVACLPWALEAHAQVPPSATDYQVSFTDESAPAASAPSTTFRSHVDVVALNVVVTDGSEKFVTGLRPDDFAVYEDGVQQDLSFFGASDLPLDLAILIDTSASMTGKLSTAQQAAIGFMSTLRPRDRAIIVDIKDASRIASPLGDDLDGARKAVLATTPGGGTALYNGTYLALKEMTRERGGSSDVRRQALVVLSDGADTSSLVSFDDVMDLAKRSGISIYTISLRSKAELMRASRQGHTYFSNSDYSMKALAQETGARAFFPSDISELSGVYASIAQELSTQYALGYTSKNPRADGTYRRVIVRVDRPETRTRTRNGYLASRNR